MLLAHPKLVNSETFCVGVTMVLFAVVCLVTWPLSGSEAKVDSLDTNLFTFHMKINVLMLTSLHLHSKSTEVCIRTKLTPA